MKPNYRIIYSSGLAVGVVVSSGGRLCVSSGGTAAGKLTFESGAYVSMLENSVLNFELSQTSAGSDAALVNDLSIIQGTPMYTLTADGKLTHGTYDYRLADGAAEFNSLISVVNSAGDELGVLTVGETVTLSGIDYTLSLSQETLSVSVVKPYAVVSSGLVLSKGTRTIGVDELYEDTTICSHASLYVSSGGMATITTVNDGNLFVSSGGMANSSIVNSGGSMWISGGGTALNIVESGGGVTVDSNASVTFVQNAFSGFVISAGEATVHSGTTASDITLSADGRLIVYSGGIANNIAASRRRRDIPSLVVSDGGIVDGVVLFCNHDDRYIPYIRIESGGNVSNITANPDEIEYGRPFAAIDAQSGGIVSGVVVNGTLTFDLFGGGTVNDAIINESGSFRIISGAVNNATINSGGRLGFESGGRDQFSANHVVVNRGATLNVNIKRATVTDIIENGGHVNVSSGTTVTFGSNTFSGLVLNSASTDMDIGPYVDANGAFATVHSGTTAVDTTVNSSCGFFVYSGGSAVGVCVHSGGSLTVSSGGILTGKMTFESGARVNVNGSAVLNFDLTQVEAGAEEALVNEWSLIRGAPIYTLTVSDEQQKGVYTLAEGAAKFNKTITVQNTSGESFGTLAVGETLSVGDADYTLNLTDDALTVTVELQDLTPTNLVGTADGLSWNGTGADAYVVELSTGDPGNVLAWTTRSTAQDLYDLPGGMYQWRVKADGNSDWAVGNEIVSEEMGDTPQFIKSNGDGNTDVFFANAVGTWESGYLAQHVGSINDWSGTNEYATIFGKNKLADIIEGSTDANILLMTDDENGDALFVDDIYSALPGSVKEQQARIAQIDEIRAGFGDDIVDMTSQRFEYIGDGLTIRGGAGNDIIWANKGDNFLFGDAGNDRIVGASGNDVIAGGIGNDRMHGGGGDDVFTFCDNWGTDTVEQLATGSITLWFASGNESNWNAETLTYTDGENSVKVSGVSEVKLKFGYDGSVQYATLAQAGAFFDATSERIFEEPGKGILASL